MSGQSSTSSGGSRKHSSPWWQRTVVSHEGALVALLTLVLVVAALSVDNFASARTANFLLLDVAPLLMMASAMALVIVAGEIDLSVASIFGLTSVVLGLLVQAEIPAGFAILLAIGVGTIAGLFNGYLVAYVGLPSLAVTIGTLALYRGIAVGSLGTNAVTDFPAEATNLARSTIGDTQIPLIMLPVLVVALTAVIILHYTPFGRGVFAIGQNSTVAAFSGVNIQRTKLLLFAASGTMAAVGGTFLTLRFSNAIGNNGVGLELQVIAAVVLGGVSIFGGRGTVFGALTGVLLIGALASSLRLAGIPANTIDVVTGGVLIVSVLIAALEAVSPRRRGRRNPSGVADKLEAAPKSAKQANFTERGTK